MGRLGTLPTIALNLAGNPVPSSFMRDLGNYRLANTATGGNFQSRPWTSKDKKTGVRADYTRHDFEDDAGKADVWSVGYVRKF